MALDPHEILQGGSTLDGVAPAPLGGTRQQRLQRLQVGLLGLGGILLLVGLANIIISSARESEVAAVTDLPPATAEDLPDSTTRDPLADAGVAPDLLTEEEQAANSAKDNGTQLVPID
ncbi:MAG: hypothetical protein ABIT10_04690 [Alteraurantiacibacter sp.]